MGRKWERKVSKKLAVTKGKPCSWSRTYFITGTNDRPRARTIWRMEANFPKMRKTRKIRMVRNELMSGIMAESGPTIIQKEDISMHAHVCMCKCLQVNACLSSLCTSTCITLPQNLEVQISTCLPESKKVQPATRGQLRNRKDCRKNPKIDARSRTCSPLARHNKS